MTRCVVTGCAGFIGSTLTDALLARGDAVLGVDCFTPYYAPAVKRANLRAASSHERFELVEADLRTAAVEPLLDGADVVFHLAAQPGVRLSWSAGFADYDSHNLLATQRLLEAAVATGRPRVVYASSSSVYGAAPGYPTAETELPRPHAPYGVTKLAGEHLCHLYSANWRLPSVALRYFTVYGPRQRPDMAIHRLLSAGMGGEPFVLHGDGSAVRDFTFVDDVVAATIAAGAADLGPGTTINVAGGSEASMAELIELAERTLDRPIVVERQPPSPGDVARTGGAIDLASRLLGWAPATPLVVGLAEQAAALSATEPQPRPRTA